MVLARRLPISHEKCLQIQAIEQCLLKPIISLLIFKGIIQLLICFRIPQELITSMQLLESAIPSFSGTSQQWFCDHI